MIDKFIKNKKILKVLLFSIICILLIVLIFKNFKIKKQAEEEILININKEYRSNYPKTETVWAKIEIPSLKINSNVYRGEDKKFLNYGVLHHKESYFPTEGGTILIAGNNTYFKDLSKIKINEKIKLNTIYGSYKYIVEQTEIKNASKLEKELEIKNTEEKLILYTPYPDIPGYKSDRFVVYASLVGDNK